MNNISMLKEIGLKEVARKTHIELKYLEAIVEKDFESLCKKNVKGYIKILSREYDVDFENWMKEFEEYSLAHNCDEATSQTPFVSPKIPAYRQKDKSHSSLYSVIILFIVVFLAWFFDAAKYITMLPNLLNDDNRSVTYSDSKVVEEVEKNIMGQNSTNPLESNMENNQTSLDVNITTTDANTLFSINQISDKNSSLIVVDENITKKDTNASLKTDTNTSFSSSNGVLGYISKKVTIRPKTPIWIGIIDLQSGSKKTFTTSKDYEVDMNKSQLILTGHGNFTIDIDGENKPSGTQNAARYIVKDGEFKAISADEFINLNKGKAW